MNPGDLQRYLHDRIPLARAMQVEVRAATTDGVEIYAPLEPNINHRDTVIGGSASAVAILAAWSAPYVRMRAAGRAGWLVIRRNRMSYERPIVAGFTATAAPPDDAAWAKAVAALAKGRPARVSMSVTLECQGEAVGRLDGEFVVMPVA
ncbi:MAG: YiiD C-terminal domain-containing protein [Steroidobacteraceae bacterium]